VSGAPTDWTPIWTPTTDDPPDDKPRAAREPTAVVRVIDTAAPDLEAVLARLDRLDELLTACHDELAAISEVLWR